MTKKYIFLFTFSSLILTIVWIATNIYHSQVTTTIEPLLQTQIVPIAPTFDEQAIAELRKRTTVEPLNTAPVVPGAENADISITPTPDEGEEALSPIPVVEDIEGINELEPEGSESL